MVPQQVGNDAEQTTVCTAHRVTTCLENLEMSPGEFDSCQGNVGDFTENQGNVRELSGKKSCQGKVAYKLFIASCIFVSIQVFSRSLLCLKC